MDYQSLVGHMNADQLNALIRAAESDNRKLTIIIARNDQIKAAARMRLIAAELAEAERE